MDQEYVKSLNEDEKFALLVGILLGDGCLSLVKGKKKYIVITCSLDDDLPFFEEIVAPLLEFFRGKKTNIKFRRDCRAIEFNFTDKKLFDLIVSVGFPIGKKGPNLIIPKIFYEKNLLKYIIQGFFATDGSLVLTKNPNKYYPRIESRVIHRYLIKQIHNYLLEIGMKGNHYFCKARPDSRWKVVQDQYRFQFNGEQNLKLFKEKIGFINPKQEDKFNNFVRYNKEYSRKMKGVPTQKQHFIRDNIKL